MKTQTYSRKPFDVEAVQVTDENIEEAAAWCEGEVHKSSVDNDAERRYILVPMSNGRPKPAFTGDWILWSRNNYRVYNPVAFENSFRPGRSDDLVIVNEDPNQLTLENDYNTVHPGELEGSAV